MALPRASPPAPPAHILWVGRDILVNILGYLGHSDLGRALCTCRATADVADDAWKAACYRRWPLWARRAEEGATAAADWRRTYELLELREGEARCVPDLGAIHRLQTRITEAHRAILAEWLCEVSFEWRLDTAVVHKAVEYLDHFLVGTRVDQLSRFQLVGIACLRVSMADSPLPLPAPRRPAEKLLDAERFAHISDDTYTAAEVEAHTQAVAAAVPPAVREAPSAKMFLRSFWYRATSRGAAGADEMHVYTAAAFLLQLALLDGRAAGWPASRAAAAALSLALSLFGKPRWPAALRAYGAYTDAELAPARAAMAAAQAGFEAPQLRRLWHRRCRGHEYAEFKGEWARLLDLMACASRALGDGNGGPAPAAPARALAAGAVAPPAAAPPAALPAAVAAG